VLRRRRVTIDVLTCGRADVLTWAAQDCQSTGRDHDSWAKAERAASAAPAPPHAGACSVPHVSTSARPHVSTSTRQHVRTSAPLVLLILLAACSAKGPPFKGERDPYASFAAYRTYAWLAPGREPDANLFGVQAREAVNAQMLGKGYIKADNQSPDLWVGTTVAVEEKFTDSIGKYQHYTQAGGEKSLFEAFSLGYEEATLQVEIYDARTQRRVWRGSTDVAMMAKQRTDRACAGVAEMFKTFPNVGGVVPPEE
jgi:Domain of unknown function (DUF4136)